VAVTDDDVTLGEVFRSVKELKVSVKELTDKLANQPADRQRIGELEKRMDSLVNRTWLVVLALAGVAATTVVGLFVKGS